MMICTRCHSGFVDGEWPVPCASCHGTRVAGPLVIGIQARLGSTRFPRKVLAPIQGQPLLLHVMNRARQIHPAAIVAVLAPWGEDWPIAIPGLMMFPGLAPDDVLSRYWWLAQITGASVIVRVTGDCPALDPAVCRRVVHAFQHSQPCDYASNDWQESGYPSGLDCEVFTAATLDRAHHAATTPEDREHVTLWMRHNLERLTVHNLDRWTGPGKLSVDTPEDLEVVKAWMAREWMARALATLQIPLASSVDPTAGVSRSVGARVTDDAGDDDPALGGARAGPVVERLASGPGVVDEFVRLDDGRAP